jgi:response regulator RpfG family c-di-GMP phosphodiesterase
MKILYVDDEATNLFLFQELLKMDFEVVTALSGREGIGIIKENADIGVVFSDMKMPGMNGIEFLSEARGLLSEVPFYILTGFEVTESIRTALDNGLILKYFKKPMDLQEITKEVKSLIKE